MDQNFLVFWQTSIYWATRQSVAIFSQSHKCQTLPRRGTPCPIQRVVRGPDALGAGVAAAGAKKLLCIVARAGLLAMHLLQPPLELVAGKREVLCALGIGADELDHFGGPFEIDPQSDRLPLEVSEGHPDCLRRGPQRSVQGK
jgi:hypothetical protein